MSKNNTLDSEQLTDSMYYILLSLLEERHGYAIMKFIEDLTHGNVAMGPGTLYTLLKKLSKAGWIQLTSATDDRTKVYHISEEGRQVLINEFKRRSYMVEEGRKILQEAGYEE
ncbi:PadR family transcriptional regulator [[Eubacterium] hominis]|uniref:PadR family transcriptional regulator n=1 Tax=[Eubacterium] hominis TaxID=2764325 RepID=UPI003A4D64EE